MVAKIERERKKSHHRKPFFRLVSLRLCLLAATLVLSGLSVLHSLSSTQIQLTSEQDYRRLSFIATVRPQTEDTEHKPPACERAAISIHCQQRMSDREWFEMSLRRAGVKRMHGCISMHTAAAHRRRLTKRCEGICRLQAWSAVGGHRWCPHTGDVS